MMISKKRINLPSQSTIDDLRQFIFPEVSVLSHLSSLDTTKATGPDDLSARFLKEICNEIVEPLTALPNGSLQTGFIISLQYMRVTVQMMLLIIDL